MPNELNIALANSGLTVTAQRYQSGAPVGSAISLSEISTSGVYTGNMAGSAGTYQLAFISAGKNVGSGQIVWDGTNEVASSAPTVVQIRQELDSNSTRLANLDTTVSSRLAPSGTLATVTTLTNAPASVTPSDIWSHASRTLTSASGPTAADIRTEMDSNSTKLANLDATVSSRLATAGYTAPTTPPTASANASAVWSAATRTLTSSSSGGPTAVEIRQELDSNSTKLADIAAIKATTDALDTARLANVATTNIVGTLLAQSNS